MTAEEFAGVAFAPGSVRGTRSFRVTPDGHLKARIFETLWEPGVNVATCQRRGLTCGFVADAGLEHRHSTMCTGSTPCGPRSPGKDCKCGFYGYYDGSLDYADNWSSVNGVVEGSGLVSIGPRGFRAEKARLLALYIPDPEAFIGPRPFPVHHALRNVQWASRVPITRTTFLTDSLIGYLRDRYLVPFYTDLMAMLTDFPPDQPRVKEV